MFVCLLGLFGSLCDCASLFCGCLEDFGLGFAAWVCMFVLGLLALWLLFVWCFSY